MAEGLAFDAVLLVGEGQGDIVRAPNLGVRNAQGAEPARANEEGDVAESERPGLRFLAAVAVLARPEQEEEGDVGHVGKGDLCGIAPSHAGGDVVEKWERDGPHAGGRWVFFLVGGELPLDPKVDLAHRVHPGVVGPHAGEDLRHRPEVLLHRPFSNSLAARGQEARSDALGENLKDGDGVADAAEVGVDAEPVAVGRPLVPRSLVGFGATAVNVSGHLFPAKAESVQRLASGGRVNSVQDLACGYLAALSGSLRLCLFR